MSMHHYSLGRTRSRSFQAEHSCRTIGYWIPPRPDKRGDSHDSANIALPRQGTLFNLSMLFVTMDFELEILLEDL